MTIINILRTSWLLDTLCCRIFSITASYMRKLIWVCFPVHCVRKTFSVACLVHNWTSTPTTHSAYSSYSWYTTDRTLLNTSGCRTNHWYCCILNRSCHAKWWTQWTFIWRTVGNSVICIVRILSFSWGRLRERSWSILMNHIW